MNIFFGKRTCTCVCFMDFFGGEKNLCKGMLFHGYIFREKNLCMGMLFHGYIFGEKNLCMCMLFHGYIFRQKNLCICMLFHVENPATFYFIFIYIYIHTGIQTRNSRSFVWSVLVLNVLWLYVCLPSWQIHLQTYIFTIHRRTVKNLWIHTHTHTRTSHRRLKCTYLSVCVCVPLRGCVCVPLRGCACVCHCVCVWERGQCVCSTTRKKLHPV